MSKHRILFKGLGKEEQQEVDKKELAEYYKSRVELNSRAVAWRRKLGDDLNWHLSFDHLREKDTTKHVHRLHPYKGKFIPQLVEYFLDENTDEFKQETHFQQFVSK